MNNPTVWQPGVGGLSLLRISTVANGQTCDRQEISFGFRTVALRGPHVYINGEKTLILGAACHEQHPTFGNSLPEWQAEHDIRLMRAVGLNAVRASHYPHSQGFYRACDRLGMLVFSELPCWQFNAYHYEHDSVREFCCDYACLMVEQLGYHPSLIGWVVQCESDTHSPAAKDFFGAIARAFKTNDPTRLTMSAESAKPPEHLQTSQKKADDAPVVKETESVVQSEVDILGLNLYAAWYADKSERLPQALDAMHSSLPAKPLLISEFGAEGIPGHRSLTMEPWTEDYQAEVLCRHIRAILDRDYVTGFFLWLFMDYECSSIGILGINSKGLVTPERKPKLAFNAVRQLLVTERGVASP